MHKKFEINTKKMKGSCQSRRKVVTHNSKSDLPLIVYKKKCTFFIRQVFATCFQMWNNSKIRQNLTGKESDSEISCYAEQVDTFGDVLFSNEVSIDVIIESGGITNLSVGHKVAIAIGILFIIFMIKAIIFLAWYFGWCCWKDRKKTTESKLMVHDQPTNIERVKR